MGDCTGLDDGTACDDGDGCTVGDTCQAEACVAGDARDCSGMDDACNTGTCDATTGSCVATAVDDGTACDDGDACNEGATCTGGTCGGGSPKDCSGMDDACNTGACDAGTGDCVAQPVADDTPCDDEDACTENDVCTGGICGGATKDCSALDDACNTGICDASGNCAAQPVADDTACDDGDACTENDVCTAGTCGGGAKDCSALDDACNTGTCDADSGNCVATPAEDGADCEDGDLCTTGETCTGGACGGGGPVDCSGLDDNCVAGACDSETGDCVANNADDGTVCEDGDLCTEGETCTSGVCGGGGPKDCTAEDDACNTGSCNDTTGECEATPLADNTVCDDGDLCTSGTFCTAGACGGGTTLDCSGLDDADACALGACNPDSGECVTVATEDGSECDDEDLCTSGDVCSGGTCAGTAADCSGLDDVCQVGVCDSDTGDCIQAPAINGTECDDESLCTDDEACLDGACVGTQPDCTALDGLCKVGVCEPDTGNCAQVDADDGAACDDADLCTGDGSCETGLCQPGLPIDCTALDEPCAVGTCDPLDGSCFADPILENGECDDGNACTEGELCDVDGNCGDGTDVDCSAEEDQCNAAACDEVDGCFAEPVDDGTGCDDADDLTDVDICVAGACLGCTSDAAEPTDNDSAGATVIGDGESISGGSVCGDDSDWFTFDIPADGWSVIAILSDGEGGCPGDLDMELIGQDATTVLAEDDFDGPGDCAFLSPVRDDALRATDTTGLVTGSYFLRVFADTSETPIEGYQLDVLLVEPETEPNDDAATATPYTEGATAYGEISGGDEDWLAIDIPEGATFEAITGVGGCGVDTVLEFYDVDGTTRLASNDDTTGLGLCSHLNPANNPALTNLPAGTYYLNVQGFSSFSSGWYGVEFSIVASAEEEPNDDAANANDFQGNLPVQHNLSSDTDVDVWAFQIDTDGSSVRAWTWNPDGSCSTDTLIELLAPDGVTVLDSSSEFHLAPPCGGIIAPWAQGAVDLLAGTYYLRVTAENADSGAYSLFLLIDEETVFQYESEPNDDVASSTALAAPPNVIYGMTADADVDIFSFVTPEAQANYSVEIDMSDGFGGCAGGFTATLWDTDGTTVLGEVTGECEGFGPDTDLWTRNLLPDSEYYISVAVDPTILEGGPWEMNYNIFDLNFETEPNDDALTANGPITSTTQFASAIDPGGDHDWYQVDVTVDGTDLVVHTDDGDGSCSVDTFIIFHSDDGAGNLTELDRDDDDGPGVCSRLDAAVDGSMADLAIGTYYVQARGFSSFSQGDYTLHVEFVEDIPVP